MSKNLAEFLYNKNLTMQKKIGAEKANQLTQKIYKAMDDYVACYGTVSSFLDKFEKKLIQYISKGANLEEKQDDRTVLENLLYRGLNKQATLLIEMGCDIKTVPVILCATEGASLTDNTYMIEHLLKLGADINLKSSRISTTTALHAASQINNSAILEFLIDNGADINALNQLGEDATSTAKRANLAKNVAILNKFKSQTKNKLTNTKTAEIEIN